MKIDVYTQQGKKLKTKIELNDKIFGVEPSSDLMAQYVRVYLARKRQGTASTKRRGEVRGGGRKPWRQKGTGKARHGSIRSPLWVGGGVAHGPKPRNFRLFMSQKMRRRALFSALSEKVKEGRFLVLDKLELKKIKTKEMFGILSSLPLRGKVLLVLEKSDENIIKSARNITRVRTAQAKNLNAHAVLNHDTVVFTKEGLKVLEEVFLR